MSSRVSAGSNVSSNQDPRRENRIYRYIPVTNKPNQDPLPDYVSLLGMIFSMLGLMIRVSKIFTSVSIEFSNDVHSTIVGLYFCIAYLCNT